MTDNKKDQQLPKNNEQTTDKKPNEIGSLHVEGFVKIFDPNTKEVYLESRA